MHRLYPHAHSTPRNLLCIVATLSLLAFGCDGGGESHSGDSGGSTSASAGSGGTSSTASSRAGNSGQAGRSASSDGSSSLKSSSAGSSGTAGATANTGGSSSVAGSGGTGGMAGKGGASAGGVASGGTASGGASGKGGTTSGGGASGGGTTSTGATGSVFSQCRFHFGTIDAKAKSGGAALIDQLDYFTPGWMGTNGDTFDQAYVCEEGKQGGVLGKLVPVVVSYIAAGYVKRHHQLCDANVSGCPGGDLAKNGAQYITQDWNAILAEYKSFANGYANCWGTTRPIVFEMEPDWYQYTISNQTQAWSAAQAGSKMTELVNTLKASLPNAHFSLDVSPWVGANGADHGKAWYSNFNMSLFTFVNTSGGGTNANTAKIRSANSMTWAGLSAAAGKPILADTGYGANGMSAGHDGNWDVATNINARIADGVISIAQYNPNGNWGSTIAGIRGQLSKPKFCP